MTVLFFIYLNGDIMKKIIIIFLLLIPINVFGLEVSSKSAILMDEDTGRILYAKDIDNKMLIASTTKIMTAILAIESNKLDSRITIGKEITASYGSNIYLSLNEEIKLIDLIYGLMLRSGNDASLSIAVAVSNSVDKFVRLMNDKALEIGMTNTSFCNPNGLDEKCENISTSRDMAILTKYANSNETYKKIVGTKRYISKTNLKTYDWYNKNKLLSTYKYTTGGKTGFTDKARRTLVTSATKDNINLIVVTLNDPNDFTTHKNLYEYGFNNFKRYLILSKGDFNLINDYYKNLYIKNDFYYLLKNDEVDKISVKYKLNKINNPKDKEIIGKAIVYLNNTIIKEENIYIRVSKKKESIISKILSIFK